MKLIIAIIIIDIYFIISLTPNETWNLILKDFSEGKLLNESKDFFIFQEDNYTRLDINNNKMVMIYLRQYDIFSLCNIKSYIFAINNSSGVNITIFRNNIRDQNDAKIYTGSNIRAKYIPDSTAVTIKQTLLNNMKKKEYYTAWNTFIEDIQDICFAKFISSRNTTTTNTNTNTNNGGNSGGNYIRHSSSSNSNIGEKLACIFGGIGSILVIVGAIVACIKCGCCKNFNNINRSYRSDYNYNNNYNNNYDTYSNRYSNNNISVGRNSVGNNSVGGNSIGGQSCGNNSVGGNSAPNNDNDGCSGGA